MAVTRKRRTKKAAKPHLVEQAWMETYTGQKFHLDNEELNPDEIHLEDIAYSLSMQCRYTGHTRGFYSVAEHSIHITDQLKLRGESLAVQFTGLLHDAAEAYIGDLARPVKVMLPAFKALEDRIDVALAKRFNVIFPFPPVIKDLDVRIIKDERAQCMGDSGNVWGTDMFEPLGVTIQFWTPAKARAKFLGRFHDLNSRL